MNSAIANELIDEIEKNCQSDFCPDCREVRHMIGAAREEDEMAKERVAIVTDQAGYVALKTLLNINEQYKKINGLEE